ncbi:MAG: hypothetical protein AB1499_10565 [Nitrospirota bacterium]
MTSRVEIMSPHYSTLRDGNRTTIPEDYIAKDYSTPGFNITGLGNLFRGGAEKSGEQ